MAFDHVTDTKKLAVLVNRLKESVQYYVNGTAKGFLQFRAGKVPASAASEGFAPSGLADVPPEEDASDAFASDTQQGIRVA